MIVASSPMARCRKPPILALAYISPARSSKRRMSAIACSHSRASAFSGSSCCCFCSMVIPTRRYSRGHDRRHGVDVYLRRVALELPRDPLAVERPDHRVGMDLARRGGDEERVGIVEIAAGREGLSERGEREGDGAA